MESNGLQPEHTFAKLSEMTHLFFPIPIVNADIINKDYDEQSKYCLNTLFIKSMKYVGALVIPNDITKFIMTIPSSEGCFWNVTISDSKLMITRSEVYL